MKQTPLRVTTYYRQVIENGSGFEFRSFLFFSFQILLTEKFHVSPFFIFFPPKVTNKMHFIPGDTTQATHLKFDWMTHPS